VDIVPCAVVVGVVLVRATNSDGLLICVLWHGDAYKCSRDPQC
jgi:hypothetical protein